MIQRIRNWLAAPAHSLPRKLFMCIVLLCGFAVPMYYWSRDGGAGTKKLDPPTLIQTAFCNMAGLVLIYVVGLASLSAMLKHLTHPFSSEDRHEHCWVEFLACLVVGGGSAVLGGMLIWQTIDPAAKGKWLGKLFSSAVGTPQYYRSGIQSLVVGLGVVLVGYVLVQDIKLRRELSRARRGIVRAPQNARTRSIRSRKQLPGPQTAMVPQGNQGWSDATTVRMR